MEGYSEAIAVMDRPKFAFCKPETHPKVTLIHLSIVSLWGRLLLFVGSIVEYAFGAPMGFAAGWLVGLYLGTVYVKHFEPVYFSDYSGLDEIFYWSTLHYDFAYFGRIVGIPIGAILILIFKNGKSVRCWIVEFFFLTKDENY